MRRAFGYLAAAIVLGAPAPSVAFHTVDTFSDAAAEGGGSGIYYTGSPRFKGWTCTACHLDAPGELLLNLRSEPRALFEEGVYEPNQNYKIFVEFRNEARGLDSRANYNTFAVEFVDAEDMPVGGFFGFDENLMRATPGSDVLFARGQKNIDISAWDFDWQAPPAGRGFLDLYIAAVDGDGASSTEAEQGDPLNDDVATGALRIAELGVPAPARPGPVFTEAGCRAVPASDGLVMLGLPLAWWLWRRRRRP